MLKPLIGENPRQTIFLEGGGFETDRVGRILNPSGVPYYFGMADTTVYLVSFQAPQVHLEAVRSDPREARKFTDSVVYF